MHIYHCIFLVTYTHIHMHARTYTYICTCIGSICMRASPAISLLSIILLSPTTISLLAMCLYADLYAHTHTHAYMHVHEGGSDNNMCTDCIYYCYCCRYMRSISFSVVVIIYTCTSNVSYIIYEGQVIKRSRENLPLNIISIYMRVCTCILYGLYDIYKGRL